MDGQGLTDFLNSRHSLNNVGHRSVFFFFSRPIRFTLIITQAYNFHLNKVGKNDKKKLGRGGGNLKKKKKNPSKKANKLGKIDRKDIRGKNK